MCAITEYALVVLPIQFRKGIRIGSGFGDPSPIVRRFVAVNNDLLFRYVLYGVPMIASLPLLMREGRKCGNDI